MTSSTSDSTSLQLDILTPIIRFALLEQPVGIFYYVVAFLLNPHYDVFSLSEPFINEGLRRALQKVIDLYLTD